MPTAPELDRSTAQQHLLRSKVDGSNFRFASDLVR
jgi:hypothetical protein